MHKISIRAFLCLCALCVFSLNAQAQTQYSGWLKDYSGLESYQDNQGNTVMRKVNPKLTPQNYKAVMLENAELYPKPQPTDAVSEKTLRDVGVYVNNRVREVLSSQVKIVGQPGPGVARIRLALTGVSVGKADLEAYQYIPIAFLLTQAKRAASGAPQQVKIFIEAEMTDSVSGERLLVAVREGKGESFEGKEVTVDSLKSLLDKWAEAAAAEVPNFIAPK
jgi:hypothetical protein